MRMLKYLDCPLIVLLAVSASWLLADEKPKRFVVPQRFVIPEEFQKPEQDPDENQSQPTRTASPLLPSPQVALIVSPSTISSPSACPLDASVIVTAMGQGRTFVCSGTCVDYQSGVSTVLTCAHEFRGLTKPVITVTHKQKEFPAKLLRLDDANDLAVLEVNADLPAVELATVKPTVGDQVTSIGISHDEPTRVHERSHKITAVDKYNNPRNFETDGQQIVGRSGGGLFFNGGLCGIIQGRRNDVARSIYVSIEPIREILAKSQLRCESCAVEQYGSVGSRRLVKAYSLERCVNCKREREDKGEGSLTTKIDWTDEPIPMWIRRKLPRGYEAPVYVWQTGENQFQWPQRSNGITMDQLDKWTEESNAFYEPQADPVEVGSPPVGATIQGRAAIAQFLSTIESIGGPECSIELKVHREGGLDAFLINKMPTRQEFFGTSGRVEINVTTTKKVPIHSIKFDYRFDKNKLFIKPDWMEIEIPEDGVVQSGPQPVGSVLMTAWTIMSIGYDVWKLFHPTVDLWVGSDINATAKYAGGKLSIDAGPNPPAVRLHWAFCWNFIRFEYSRPLTGGLMSPELCVLQFHKSRLFRDVNIEVK